MEWQELEQMLRDSLAAGALTGLRLSRPLGGGETARVDGRPIRLKVGPRFQLAFQDGARVTHRNLTLQEVPREVLALLRSRFRSLHLFTKTADIQISRKGDSLRAGSHPPSRPAVNLLHDRDKRRPIPEGGQNRFLQRLGVMTADGRVVAAKRDKYRQINRFLEMVEDIADRLPRGRCLEVVDFGCGKSYLTFALRHYLREILALDARIIGVDVRNDVLKDCRRIAQELQIPDIEFRAAEIRAVQDIARADLVVSLHACDTATDDALARAVEWDASVILAVPCCHKELLRQMENPLLRPLLRHGILKERTAALVTDALRASLLEMCGYSTQVMEFVETEHTPRNLLIRAVKRKGSARSALPEEYRAFRDFWSARPALEGLLRNRLPRLRSADEDRA